ncbi:AMP-binding protein [Bdellovibrio reynosensis]|uniref:AMP-binding protein n=1 Tax=Bdellovibrio reynosensis TaxID=2835041 RepID=A0ABY4C5Z6_9BACT|nr:AMP-binding protein [Bdellovibrio reynosensis]UOE99908.1 AMP-binding protein [Bdellovibrio reynosensis]
MASTQNALDLSSQHNEILLNPRWPKEDFAKLYELANHIQIKENLKAHVWIATSGSTASSVAATKLVALSKQALVNSATAVNKHLQSNDKDVWTQVLPSFHVGGLGIEIRSQLSGAKVVPALKDERWDPLHFHQVLEKEKCTLSALVPTQVFDLVSKTLPAPSSLRAVVVGGGVLDQELYRKALVLGWPLLPSYGMTETASQIATADLNSLGHPYFPEVKLLSHAQARTNNEGFIEVSSTSLFTMYAQNTFEGFKSWDPKINGWFTTEDRGQVLGDNLVIEGRAKDYIKIGGEGTNVARLRSILENCIQELFPQNSLNVCILEMDSQRLGQEIHMVSLLSATESEKLVQLYSEKVLPFEKVRKIHYVSELPRTELGKIKWEELKRQVKGQL